MLIMGRSENFSICAKKACSSWRDASFSFVAAKMFGVASRPRYFCASGCAMGSFAGLGSFAAGF